MPHQRARPVRQKSGRSTTGCTNCKIRKVKCDEGKPACLRCQGRDLECPGYPTNVLKWSSKHEVHKTGKAQDAPNLNSRPDGSRFTALRAAGSIATPENRNILVDTAPGLVVDLAKPIGPEMENTGALRSTHSPATTSSIDLTSPGIEQYLGGIDHAFNVNTADLEFAYSNADNEYGDVFSPAVALPNESYSNTFQSLFRAATKEVDTSDCSADVVSLDTDQVESHDDESLPMGTLVLPSVSPMWEQSTRFAAPSLSSTLMHIPTLLVEYYFQKVCRECSTFDSSVNPFRSKISEMQHTSAPVHYVIQSLAASKLADDMPSMRVVGIEAQGKALQTLKEEFSTVNALHAVSDGVLFTLLLLGMTTSWHTREDLGLEYLHLARRIVAAKAQSSQVAAVSNLDFYQEAIGYWTMIASIVSGDVEYADTPATAPLAVIGPSRLSMAEKIMPHPWAGISPRSLQLFGQVLQLIRKTRRGFGSKTSSSYSRAGVVDIANAIATAERLEAECWLVSIPPVNHLKDTGDLCTPPFHHVLTAKAYLMSALLQLYIIFPDVLEARIQSVPASNTVVPASEDHLRIHGSAHIVSESYLWSQRSPGDHRNAWLKDVGRRIVECLEGIDSRSSTRVVHAPLLLSVANALTLQHEVGAAWSQSIEISNLHVHRHRSFIVSRLETMQAAMRFHAIDNILKVIKEVWKRSDAGQQDTFWMDVMSELRCETLFG